MSMNAVSISDGEATVKISKSGGLILSYSLKDGFDLMRPSPAEDEENPNPRNCASFPLIPYSNRIKNGKLTFKGKSYTLPLNFGDHPHSIHGIGWTAAWDVTDTSKTEVTLKYIHEGKDWPFPFAATQRFSLRKGALRQEISIQNTGKTPMPVGMGLHPYFPRHDGAELQAELPNVWMTTDTGIPTERISTPKHWSFTKSTTVDAVTCDNVFECWNGNAQLSWPNNNKSLRITAHPDLDRLVIYIPKGESYFCVEPASHVTDAFNLSEKGMPPKESGMRVLAPGEYWNIWVRFSPN